MRRTSSLAVLALVGVIAAAGAGCQKKAEEAPAPAQMTKPEPFRVTGMELGRAITADKKVAAPLTVFGAKDTIYVSIASVGAADSVRLVARWHFEDGQLVAEDAQVLAPNGPAQTEFHILRPGGWPKGRYTLEVFRDTTSLGTRDFNVQ